MLGKGTFDAVRLLVGLTAAIFILLIGGLLKNSPRQAFFEISRTIARENLNITTCGLQQIETRHFIIKYDVADRDNAKLVAAAAEEMYEPMTGLFGFNPPRRTLVVLYPDSESLAKSFGWDKDEQAMGVYWAGAIRVLNPDVWITSGDKTVRFSKEGPMTHEFVHLLVDYKTNGNYPRWLTEGIAQYAEKRFTGFEFKSPFKYNSQPVAYYDIDTLESQYDNLDQGIAYWESLKAVELIVDKYGEEKIFRILDYLGKGQNISQAFENSTGQSFDVFLSEMYVSFNNLKSA